MKKKFAVKYFYPIKVVQQINFENKMFDQDIYLKGHIVLNEVIMCGIGRDLAKSRAGATKHKLVATRIAGVGICEDCLEQYKQTRGTDWYKWTRSVKNTV